jgi:pyridoxamine 5'-phosphate oxidase
MNKEEMMQFMQSHPVFQLGTIDGDKPRVRTISLFRADENGIMFYTSTFKDVYKQLITNPHVELCFVHAQPATEIRVSGKVELVDDDQLKNQINSENPGTVAIFVLRNGKATAWKMETSNEPKTYIDL